MNIEERAELYGVDALIPHEIINLITGIPTDSINAFESVSGVFNSIELINCSKSQKNKLRALRKLCRETGANEAKGYKITKPSDVYQYYACNMQYEQQEIFKVIFLNCKNIIIDDKDIFKGTLNSTTVHPREVFKEAVLKSSAKIIIMHNHPSGSIEPSTQDENLTALMVKCGKIMDIEVMDHIIIGEGFYYSFKENFMI